MINVCLVRGAVFAYVEAECVTWREGRDVSRVQI